MSRIGKLPVELPEKVSLKISGQTVNISGPKGELSKELPGEISVEAKDNLVKVIIKRNSKNVKALHGTYRALIANMVKGVNEGWSKTLELVGAGYRAELVDGNLILNVGFSHPVEIKSPDGITFSVQKTQITIDGIDKELVGEIAAQIRKVRPPEPYKGKGIKYQDEIIRRKPGKAAKALGATAT